MYGQNCVTLPRVYLTEMGNRIVPSIFSLHTSKGRLQDKAFFIFHMSEDRTYVLQNRENRKSLSILSSMLVTGEF